MTLLSIISIIGVMTTDDDTPVEKLLNLGPACKRWLLQIGVRTRGDLRRTPLEELYEKVKRCTPQCNGVFLYAVFGALTDTHWNALPRDIQKQLLETARGIDTRLRNEKRQ